MKMFQNIILLNLFDRVTHKSIVLQVLWYKSGLYPCIINTPVLSNAVISAMLLTHRAARFNVPPGLNKKPLVNACKIYC